MLGVLVCTTEDCVRGIGLYQTEDCVSGIGLYQTEDCVKGIGEKIVLGVLVRRLC